MVDVIHLQIKLFFNVKPLFSIKIVFLTINLNSKKKTDLKWL
jgi:hypothetical protein